MAQFHFDLVSPERLVLSEAVEEVVVPGAEGEFGVLAGHTPIIATLKPGIVRVRGGDKAEPVYVAGGLAEFSNDQLTILAEQAVPVSELDADKIAQSIKDAEEDVRDAKDDEARSKAETHLQNLRDAMSAIG